jgi:hypothetical protein
LITDVDLGGSSDEYATTTAGDSTVVVAASTESPAIWFIDPRTDRLLGETRLPPSSGHTIFGGNGGYVTSIAMDSAHDRAILAVWNGFAIVDVRARRITSVIEVPPSENFAFDPVHGRVVAPFYDCASSVGPDGNSPTACGSTVAPDGSPMTDGLTLIDLEDETVYTYQNPDAELPAAPVGMTPGSAAIDPETGLVIVTAKRKHYQSIIDLAAAHFDSLTWPSSRTSTWRSGKERTPRTSPSDDSPPSRRTRLPSATPVRAPNAMPNPRRHTTRALPSPTTSSRSCPPCRTAARG